MNEERVDARHSTLAPEERLSAIYRPEEWSEPWNMEGTPLGETLDLGQIGNFGEWSHGLLPGRYELTNGYGDDVGVFIVTTGDQDVRVTAR